MCDPMQRVHFSRVPRIRSPAVALGPMQREFAIRRRRHPRASHRASCRLTRLSGVRTWPVARFGPQPLGDTDDVSYAECPDREQPPRRARDLRSNAECPDLRRTTAEYPDFRIFAEFSFGWFFSESDARTNTEFPYGGVHVSPYVPFPSPAPILWGPSDAIFSGASCSRASRTTVSSQLRAPPVGPRLRCFI